MMITLATALSLSLSAPPRPRPAAMVLDLAGRVEIKTSEGKAQEARVGDLLYPGERLSVPAGGSATVAVLREGAQERLRPGAEATVGAGGCTPPEAVAERKGQRPAVARTMRGLRPAPGDGRKAGSSFRGDAAERPQATTPVYGATVAADKPDLAWPAADGVKSYRVRLVAEGSGREVWRAEANEPRLSYPEGKPALDRGTVYRWIVTGPDYGEVASGSFAVATEGELRQLDELKALTAGEDRADLLAAALSYRRLGCYVEAIAAYERLAKLAPEEPAYREALGQLYRVAGRGGDGAGPKPGPEGRK
jgi:hypothetical protein